ncbi:hypothetical protein HA402_000675 [Bradysia odoriphaga]|nr:hypothetical protein HA402_000675 [Bradysia odoriphaga]
MSTPQNVDSIGPSQEAEKVVNPIVIQLQISYSQVSSHKVHQYFSQYGDIQIMAFVPGFAFLRFIDDKVSMNILAEYEPDQRIEIEDQIIQMKRGDYNHLPYEMLQCIRKSMTTPSAPFRIDQLLLQPDVEKTQTNILNALNDHCLCEILERLNLLDLLAVSKTCKKLCQIAKTVFALKYKKKLIHLNELIQNGEAMTNFEYLLKNFGSSISSLGLNDGLGDGDNIFRLIDQYCNNLKVLSLDGILMRKVTIENYGQVYGRLEKLDVVGGFLGVNRVLASCHQLQEFNAMMIDCLDLTHIVLPRLVILNLRFFKCEGMGEFLMRHPNIEVLGMQMPDPGVTWSLNTYSSGDENQFILDHMPNIREMEMFETWNGNIQNEKISKLSEMRNLKSVYFDFDMKPFDKVMKEFTRKNPPVETLELAHGFIDDDAIGYICQMKTITKICFYQCIGFDEIFLARLLLNLPNLKQIFVHSGDESLNIDRILPILKDRRVEWLDEISDESFVTYKPERELVLLQNIFDHYD